MANNYFVACVYKFCSCWPGAFEVKCHVFANKTVDKTSQGKNIIWTSIRRLWKLSQRQKLANQLIIQPSIYRSIHHCKSLTYFLGTSDRLHLTYSDFSRSFLPTMQLFFGSLEIGVFLVHGINFGTQKEKIKDIQSRQMKEKYTWTQPKKRGKRSVWEDGKQRKGKII